MKKPNLDDMVIAALEAGCSVSFHLDPIKHCPAQQPKRKPKRKLTPRSGKTWVELLPKSPMPKRGLGWDWHKKYATAGEIIHFVRLPWHNKGKMERGRVDKVTANRYGRIYYQVGGLSVTMEDLQKAVQQKGTK